MHWSRALLLAASAGVRPVAGHGAGGGPERPHIPKVFGGREVMSELMAEWRASRTFEDRGQHVPVIPVRQPRKRRPIPPPEVGPLEKRQRGGRDGQCGGKYGNCARGYCCSAEGCVVSSFFPGGAGPRGGPSNRGITGGAAYPTTTARPRIVRSTTAPAATGTRCPRARTRRGCRGPSRGR